MMLESLRRAAIGVVLFWLLLVFQACAGQPRPFDEKADANAAIAAMLADTASTKPILLTFGANWCSDSRALAGDYRSEELAPLLEREFRLLFIDVGTFHRNLDITARYGNPIDKGIPSVVLLRPDGSVLYTAHGQLSAAEKMKRATVVEFFKQLAANGHVD